MIDYWEALGRLVVYEELNNQLLSILPPTSQPIPWVTGLVTNSKETGPGLNIPESRYKAVQDLFSPILAEGYLSLMGAGELIWAYSFQVSRDAVLKLQESVAQALPQLHGPSSSYFIALGLIISDEIFRQGLKAQPPAQFLRRLSDPQADQISNLANDSTFEAHATAFVSLAWEGGCDDRMVYWQGHLHPLGLQDANSGGWDSATTDNHAAKAAAGGLSLSNR